MLILPTNDKTTYPEPLLCLGGMTGGFGPRGIFWAHPAAPASSNFPFLVTTSSLASSLGAAPPPLVAPNIAGVSALTSTITGGTVTVTVPGGVQSGDIIIALVSRLGADTVDLAPSAPPGEGWTFHANSLGPLTVCPEGWMRYDIFWKRWGAAGQIDDTTPTFSYTARSNYGWSVVLTNVRGCVATGNPIEAFDIASDTHVNTGPTLTAPSVNSSGEARLSLRFYLSASINTDAGLSGFSAGETGSYFGTSYRTNIADGHWACAKHASSSRVISSAGPIGTATVGGGNSIQRWMAFTAILKPANADASTTDSLTPSIATPTTNDILIAAVHRVGGGLQPQPPSGQGWNTIIGDFRTSGVHTALNIFWKRWGAGFTDDTTPTFTITDPNNTPWGIVLTSWRRCRTTGNPWEDADISQGNGTTVTAPASTSAGTERTAVRFFLMQGTTGIGITSTDGSLVYQGSSYGNGNGTISGSQCCRRHENIGIGSSGTASAGVGSGNWIGATIILRGLV